MGTQLSLLMQRFNKKHIAGNRLLKEARMLLSQETKKYKAGNFSGHPEEQLILIDGLSDTVRAMEAAKARGWVPDENIVSYHKTTYSNWVKSDSQYYVGGGDKFLIRIGLAEKGYI